MKPKLNTRSAFLVVLLYLALSIIAALLTTIVFGGPDSSETDRLIDGVIDKWHVGNDHCSFRSVVHKHIFIQRQ